jgi:hypothetical protein
MIHGETFVPYLPNLYVYEYRAGTLFNGLSIHQKEVISSFYFCMWLLFTLYFRFKRDNYFTNKYTLLVGVLCSFMIPIANGVSSNSWLWDYYQQGQTAVFYH